MLAFWSHFVCLGTDLTHVLTSVRLQVASQASLAHLPLILVVKQLPRRDSKAWKRRMVWVQALQAFSSGSELLGRKGAMSQLT